jgi:hypothetical protein
VIDVGVNVIDGLVNVIGVVVNAIDGLVNVIDAAVIVRGGAGSVGEENDVQLVHGRHGQA